jgi:hypothetical protein
VAARRRDVLSCRIQPRNARTQSRQRLADQAAATAHVENAQAIERPFPVRGKGEVPDHLVAEKCEARRPDAMQRPELASGVPPFGRETREPIDLGGIERHGRTVWGTLAHGKLARPAADLSRPAGACCGRTALWLRVAAIEPR